MQSENRLFDDLAKLMNGVAGTVAGMSREAQAAFREKNREWMGGADFVSRDEFEAVKAMAAAARDEADWLRARLDALEGRNAAGAGSSVGGTGSMGAQAPDGDLGIPGAAI